MLNKLKSLLSAARHTFQSLPSWRVGVSVVLSFLFLSACTDEEEGAWDPYANWQTRNAAWFEQLGDSARTAIARAKAQYGDDWENHCEWRMFKSLRRSPGYNSRNLVDSICVKVVKSGNRQGDNVASPLYTDTVRVDYRGYLMNTTYEKADGSQYDQMLIFDQSYFGEFNEQTCAPAKMAVGGTVEGFCTALQYMVPGDIWMVYIPQELAYGESSTGDVPAYSTLLFKLHLAAVYHPGTKVPAWK